MVGEYRSWTAANLKLKIYDMMENVYLDPSVGLKMTICFIKWHSEFDQQI